MASLEYNTVLNCIPRLETAFNSVDRNLIHFLYIEGFMTQEIYDEVLSPLRMWTSHQKATALVSAIRNRVELDSQKYTELLSYLRECGKLYESIVNILDEEYRKQQQAHATQHLDDHMTHDMSPLAQYKDYLKSVYANLSTKDEKLFTPQMCQFINLALVKEEYSLRYNAFSRSTFHGGVDEILKSKSPLELDALVTESKFVLVAGPPGIGKSTLCSELCKKWDTLESLRHYKIVLLLRLRETRVQRATKLTEIFLHTTDELSHSVVTEVFRSEGKGVLLILDGFDEVPSSLILLKDSLIMKLICGSCLPQATRLVTSRPSALHHRSKFPDNHKHVEILGITDERKEEFAENAFLEQPHLIPGFKTYYLSNAIIKSLMYIPLNCAIIAQIYKENEGKGLVMPQTMTQLYTALITSLIRRHMIEKSVYNEDSRVPSSDIIHASALKEVSELAYRGLTKEETQIVFTESDVGEGFQHLGLLTESKEMYVSSGAKSSYSFPHLSIQEFLAALHLVHSATFEELSSFLASKDNWKKNMARFVAGLVGCCCCFPITKIKWDKYEHHVDKRQLMMNCLYEAQNSCKSMLDLNVTDVIPYVCSDPLDMYVFGYIFVHAPFQWALELLSYADVTQLVKSCSSVESQPLGTLCTLEINELYSPCTLLEFKELNFFILEQVKELGIADFRYDSPPPLEWISSFKNLHSLSVSAYCPERAGVGEVIPTPTMGEVFNFLTHLNFLIDISVFYGLGTDREIVKLGWWVEAALSHPTLKHFTTSIPFFVLPQAVTPSLESLTYDDYRHLGFLSTFCSIVEIICKMKNLEIVLNNREDDLNPVFGKYLVIFNYFLKKSSSSTIQFGNSAGLQFLPNYQRGPLSRALRTFPDLFWLKRSKSLSDLSTELYTLNKEQVHSMYGCDPKSCKLTRSQSCPELLHMQALCNMHPHLHEDLKTDTLYYDTREDFEDIVE